MLHHRPSHPASTMGLLLLLPYLVRGRDPNMGAVLNLAYGNMGGPTFTDPDEQHMFGYIKQITPNLTAIVNLMLNVPSAKQTLYSSIVNDVKSLANPKVPIYPAFGAPTNGKAINNGYYTDIVDGYSKFTDCVQIDGVQSYLNDTAGSPFKASDFYNMLDYLTKTKNFTHIQLNPWPTTSDHSKALRFPDYPQVDSAIEQVMVDYSDDAHTMYNPSSTDVNWLINTKKVGLILQANPSVQIIINYENAPAELILNSTTHDTQIKAFQTTIQSITDYTTKVNRTAAGQIHWTAPWSQNYIPTASNTNTWPFIRTYYTGKSQ